jgi:DNA-directed RNA polymerase specialized sigma24 family protein
MTSSQRQAESSAPAEFAATRWSLVLSAKANDSPQSDAALETLCRNYWRPLYAYVRRQGLSPHDAQDLTQAFFARLLEKNYLAAVTPGKGKFRSFLLAALKHFLSNEWDKTRAQKRGGGKPLVSLDYEAAEAGCALESSAVAPDAIFDRRWAVTLLERTLARLREEYIADGKVAVFEQLKETLTGEQQSIPYATVARQLASSEGAVKVAVHRLRRRYRELLRAEIADTVSGQEEIEEELRHLFAALGG